MKVTFFTTLSILLSMVISSPVWGSSNQMEDGSGNGGKGAGLQIFVQPGFTVISGQEEDLFIDYAKGNLYRLDVKTNDCVRYPLSADQKSGLKNESEKRFIADRIKLFSEIQVLKTRDDTTSGDTGRYTTTLLFGPTAMASRTARTPMLEQFGIHFIPGRVDFLVSFQHENREKISDIVAENTSYYQTYPLLRQLDFTGLIPLLGGIPVQVNRHGVNSPIHFIVEEKENLYLRLPKNCASL